MSSGGGMSGADGERVINRVREGFYLDSVVLMRIALQLEGEAGVEMAALMIGTPANKDLLASAGLLTEAGRRATAQDLIIAIRTAGQAAGEAALAGAGALLDRPRGGGEHGAAGAWRPRTLRGAVEALPGANLALISVPGAFAPAEARKALAAGLHVLIFSDNVSLAEEAALKVEARRRGLLLMGPDCGTALIGGVPLAFANAVPRGAVGIVSASGTGLQEVSTLIARMGGGVSHGIGTGGRDLHREVGGITTRMAIEALEADPDTGHIVLISKPPDPAVAEAIIEQVGNSPKPFTLCFLGAGEMTLPPNATLAATLQEAAESAMGAALPVEESQESPPLAAAPQPASPRQGWVRGLFSGGTLCAEAQTILRRGGLPVRSNVPIPGVEPVQAGDPPGHLLLDLGADEYTAGRPHPMLEPASRNGLLRDALRDPQVGVVLLDLVLGYGAHPDPARDLAGVVAAAVSSKKSAAAGLEHPVVVASVCGTRDDPQNREAQAKLLAEAGVRVAPSNAAAARLAVDLARPPD